MTQKGVFPYDYLDDWTSLDETELPTQDIFFSKLYNHHISDEEYSHARNIWQQIGISNLGEYSDMYLKTDVLLLADIFENF